MPAPRRGATLAKGQFGAGQDLQSTQNEIARVLRQLVQRVSFGDPLGGDTNGTLVNMEGSWVNVSLTSPTDPFACSHNLSSPYSGSLTRPNVRWLVWGWEHDGTGAGAADGVQLSYQYGDSMSAQSITLRPHVAGGRTVSAGHPLRLTLFFQVVSQTT